MVPILIALLAGAGFLLASRLATTSLGRSLLLQRLAMVLAAGILLGVAFADLVPEAIELAGTTRFAIGVAAGFVVLLGVESLSRGHTHHHEPHAHGHAHGEEPPCVPSHPIRAFLVGLAIHNLADGLVIGIGSESSDAAAGAVAFGILVHQLPVGLSFAAVLHADGRSASQVLRDTLLVGAMIPLGALAVLVLPDPSATTLGLLLALAAGALVYVATGHLLPEAQSEERHPSAVAGFAIALLATVLVVTQVAPHDHGHGAEHEHGDEVHYEDEHEADAH